jgi:hypothetical protein
VHVPFAASQDQPKRLPACPPSNNVRNRSTYDLLAIPRDPALEHMVIDPLKNFLHTDTPTAPVDRGLDVPHELQARFIIEGSRRNYFDENLTR